MPKHFRFSTWLGWAVVIAMGTGAASPAWAGKLGSARSSVRSGGGSFGGSHSSGSSGSSSFSGSSFRGGWGGSGGHFGFGSYDPFYDNPFAWLMFPWLGPRRLLGGSTYRDSAFPLAPYADDADGYVRIAGISPPAHLADVAKSNGAGETLLGRGSAMRVWAEGGAADLTLARGSAGFLWSGAHRLELSGEVRMFYEKLSATQSDRLWIGSIGAHYVFAQSERAQLRSGLGLRVMPDGNDQFMGAYFSYGMDLYPMRPLILSVNGDIGGLNGAAVGTLRATLGAIVDQVEVYGGYEGFWLGDVDLSMALLGARIWM